MIKKSGKMVLIVGVVLALALPAMAFTIEGAKGEKMKQIGQAARKDLEIFFGKKVFLEMWVKTLKNWKKDERSLRRLGFQ